MIICWINLNKKTQDVLNFLLKFCFRKKVDVVYSSGLGSWMNADPMKGFPEDLMEFLKNNLSSSGIAIFNLWRSS